jgi:SAM-dependent methyltransferase
MCPLCQSQADFLLSADQREYWLCPTCKLIFVPEIFFISQKEEVERYLEHENSLDNEGYVAMFQQKIDIVKTHCAHVKSVLDFGCGYEPVLQTLLQRQGYCAEAYDPNFFPDLPSGSRFDLAISTETFEHLREPRKDLEFLTSRLSPGGFLAVMTQFYPDSKQFSQLESFKSWYYKRDPTHIIFYAPETFYWIAEAFGYKVVYQNEKDFTILKKNGQRPQEI